MRGKKARKLRKLFREESKMSIIDNGYATKKDKDGKEIFVKKNSTMKWQGGRRQYQQAKREGL